MQRRRLENREISKDEGREITESRDTDVVVWFNANVNVNKMTLLQ